MHFSHGQISFVICFLAVFALALIWSYRRDKSTTKNYYAGAWKILISVAIIMATLSFILKNIKLH